MIGYVAFILLLFFPGLAAGLITGLFGRLRFVEVLGISFGLSLIFVPILLLVCYSVIHAMTPEIVYGVLVLSIVFATAMIIRQKDWVRKPSLNKTELAALALVVLQGLLLVWQFTKYPIFPSAISVDYHVHLEIALRIGSGQFSISQVTYPPGIHFLISSLLTVEPGIQLAEMQYVLALLGTLSPILIFVVVSRVLGDQRLGLVASFVYVLSGAVWYTALLVTGLYANFLANLVTLTLIFLIDIGLEQLDVRRGIAILAGGAALYLSHYTVVVFIAIIWLMLPLVWWKRRDAFLGYFETCGLIALPGVLIAIVRPDLVGVLLSIPGYSGQGAGVVSSTPDALVNFLAPISPFLNYLYQELGIGLFLLTLTAIPTALYLSAKNRGIWIPIILGWFLLTWIVTPYGAIAWRYSKLAVVPMLFLWPVTLQLVLPARKSVGPGARDTLRKRKARDRSASTLRVFIFVALVIVLLYGAPTGSLVQDLSSNTGSTAQNQEQVYQAMQWVSSHAAPSAKILGLEDWRFGYLQPIWGYYVAVYANTNATRASELINKTGYNYVLVSRFLVPGPLTYDEGLNPNYGQFQNNSLFVPVFSNPSVAVYLARA